MRRRQHLFNWFQPATLIWLILAFAIGVAITGAPVKPSIAVGILVLSVIIAIVIGIAWVFSKTSEGFGSTAAMQLGVVAVLGVGLAAVFFAV